MFGQRDPSAAGCAGAGIALHSVRLSLRDEEMTWKCCVQLLVMHTAEQCRS